MGTESFIKQMKAAAEQIEQKEMPTIQALIEILRQYESFCPECFADDSLYLDMTQKEPVVCCVWCRESIPLRKISQEAYNLPGDYFMRMIQAAPQNMYKEQIGDDLWVTDGYIAEIAGDLKLGGYPDREKFEETTALSAALECYQKHIGEYEKATLSPRLYRKHFKNIAILESATRTVYVDQEHTRHFEGIYDAYIRGPLDPVIIMAMGKICSIVLPFQFDPEKDS